jgi:hypothetical protein
MFGFLSLLRHLVAWGVDLEVQDNLGFTALHHAHLFQQDECVVFLLRSGASRFVLDHLGRTPSNLAPQLNSELGPNSLDSYVCDNGVLGSNRHQKTDCDTDIPEAERNAKYLLVKNWLLQFDGGHYRESFSPIPKAHGISNDINALHSSYTIDSCSSRGKAPYIILYIY